MPLVDYPLSDSDADDAESTPAEPPAKRRKRKPPQADSDDGGSRPTTAEPKDARLPPLPRAFHDLYASTVRRSVSDDPSLHQGRRRQTPHVVGNWPTHLYVEWHPSASQHELLVKLMRQVDERLARHVPLHDFLTSDLGTPLPLHISLSRPIALDTAHKDDFLDRVSAAIKACRVDAFCVAPTALAWYRSPDSDRTFLVLRVAASGRGRGGSAAGGTVGRNPQLVTLLAACNAVARRFEQPVLYQQKGEEGEDQDEAGSAGDAFHISIGWTFGLAADDGVARGALEAFEQREFREMRAWEVEVSGVKAKIGNVVSHVPLVARQSSRSLFGI